MHISNTIKLRLKLNADQLWELKLTGETASLSWTKLGSAMASLPQNKKQCRIVIDETKEEEDGDHRSRLFGFANYESSVHIFDFETGTWTRKQGQSLDSRPASLTLFPFRVPKSSLVFIAYVATGYAVYNTKSETVELQRSSSAIFLKVSHT